MSRHHFFDTNILVYAVKADDPRAEPARQLLAAGGMISVQALNEFASVARRKLGQPWSEINDKLAAIRTLCEVTRLTIAIHEHALAGYGYCIYDALQLAAALETGCAVFYSEDLKDGQKIRGLHIVNPFREVK
jgi:predicted nucleic acid-binding protein